MRSAELSVFRFCIQESYEYYYQKYPVIYDDNLTLYHALDSLGIAYDKTMGLRVQGLCVFDDVPLWELVAQFGTSLSIEPLSQKYVIKDLTLDKEAMFARYENFFATHSFITYYDRLKLYDFLWANTIALRDDESYLGDGFFLYMHHLLQAYPTHFDTLIHTLANAHTGVMSYVPVEALIYHSLSQNTQARTITPTIHALIDKVTRFGICQGCGRAWIGELANLRPKPIHNPFLHKQTHTNTHHTSTQTASALNVSQHGSDKDSTQAESTNTYSAYMVFDAYKQREAKPLIASTKSLLHALSYPLVDSAAFIPFGGYFGRIIEPTIFAQRVIYNLALAHKANAQLVFGDTESYTYTLWAKELLRNNSAIYATTQAIFPNLSILLEVPIHNIASIALSLKPIANSPLQPYTLACYPNATDLFAINIHNQAQKLYGIQSLPPHKTQSSTSQPTEEQSAQIESLLYRIIQMKESLKDIGQIFGGTWISVLEVCQDFSHLESYNFHEYLRQNARVRFACIDAGADIIAVSSIGQFRAFDTFAHKAAQSIGRDRFYTPTLFLPQIALLALGIDSHIGLESHTLKPILEGA